MTAAPACEIEGLAKFYDDVPVFENLSLRLMPGEVLAVTGPHGAGKTTLLRCIAGLEGFSAGAIRIGGLLVEPGHDQPAIRQRVAVVDEPGLDEDLTAWQHAALVHDGSDENATDAFTELLDAFSIATRAHDRVVTLSRGMRQKVALALALCRHSDVLLIDEPFAGLDAPGRDAFVRQVGRIRRRGGAALIATQALDMIDEFADRVFRVK
jgi:ABC-2 type transport system ATP-binding protein